MVRSLKTFALLLSAHALHPYCLHPNQMADLPINLPQAPASDLVIVLIKGVVRGMPLYWFP